MCSLKRLTVTIEKSQLIFLLVSVNLKFILFQFITSILEDFFSSQFMKTKFLVS